MHVAVQIVSVRSAIVPIVLKIIALVQNANAVNAIVVIKNSSFY